MSAPNRGGFDPSAPPKPFSREWLELPPERRIAVTQRKPVRLPAWVPPERILTGLLVVMLALSGTIAGRYLAPSEAPLAAGSPQTDTSGQVAQLVPAGTVTATNVVSLDTSGTLPAGGPTSVPTPTAGSAATAPSLQLTPAVANTPTDVDPRAILPKYRILSYYGHPLSDKMGVLGEYDREVVYEELLKEKEAWEAADPDRPVMLAFELIGSVAQSEPAENGTYLYHTSDRIIRDYIKFTRERGMLLILDMQIGRSTVEAEIDWAEEYLMEPHVHLALDPEFAMDKNGVPGEVIGGLTADEVAYAQQRLAEFARVNNLPPKVLIVHRFTYDMIQYAEWLTPVPGVQTVIDFDGWGVPGAKIEGYELFVRDQPVEFAGIKLFYHQDTPLMQPEALLELDPVPDLVIYQ